MIKRISKATLQLPDLDGNAWIVNVKSLKGDSGECPFSRYLEILFFDKEGTGFYQKVHFVRCKWCDNYGIGFVVEDVPVCFSCAKYHLGLINWTLEERSGEKRSK